LHVLEAVCALDEPGIDAGEEIQEVHRILCDVTFDGLSLLLSPGRGIGSGRGAPAVVLPLSRGGQAGGALVKWAGAMREKRIDAGTLIKEVRKLRARVAELERVGADRGSFEAGDRELDKAWRQWERTFDAIEDPIFLLDGESRILEANLAVSRFFDVPLEEILGSPCWKVVHGLDERPEDCPAAKALQTGKREKAEIYLPHKDLYLSISVDPVFDKQGKVTTIVHTIRNVTERAKRDSDYWRHARRWGYSWPAGKAGLCLSTRPFAN